MIDIEDCLEGGEFKYREEIPEERRYVNSPEYWCNSVYSCPFKDIGTNQMYCYYNELKRLEV